MMDDFVAPVPTPTEQAQMTAALEVAYWRGYLDGALQLSDMQEPLEALKQRATHNMQAAAAIASGVPTASAFNRV